MSTRWWSCSCRGPTTLYYGQYRWDLYSISDANLSRFPKPEDVDVADWPPIDALRTWLYGERHDRASSHVVPTCSPRRLRVPARALAWATAGCHRDHHGWLVRRSQRESSLMKTGPKPQVIHRALKDHPPPTPQTTFCRLWQGYAHDGYGIKRSEGRKISVPRWVIEQVGEDQFGVPWDPKFYVLHLCDQPLCFRYDHLMLGTHVENVRQAVLRGLASQTKLTVEQVGQIRRLHTGGVSRRLLAEQFGVSTQNIGHILRRYSWTDVP